ncbi:MAG: DUF4872 domain-containing protein [Anaerolineae bacterium]|nr:DUF4872 domain-containing protein [Anaerolineae bacterium]
MTVFSGGIHQNTAALKNVLAARGVVAPHTQQPFSEAMLLGIGGGLGAGYILWEFTREAHPLIVLGFRNRWNYGAEHMMALCERLNLAPVLKETAGAKGAAANLEAGLESGPVVAWVDKAHMPHQQLPDSLKGYSVHIIGIHGRDGDEFVVDDLAAQHYRVSAEVMAAGRGRIGSDKNRLIIPGQPDKIDLPGAINTGITDHLEHLGRDSESFALPVYKKWAKTFTDTKNKKGWPVVFKNGLGLYITLRSVFEGVALDGTDGAGLRALYADFLDEAAGVLGKSALKDAAASYRAVADLWRGFAEAALPGALAPTAELMRKRYAHYRANEQDAMRPISIQLEELAEEYSSNPPIDDVGALFADLGTRIQAIYEAEVAALDTLRAASS